MHLYLIRHGIADPRIDGQDHPERSLTHEGRSRLQNIVRHLEACSVRFHAIYSSPWLRATQSAEILQPLCADPFQTLDALAASPGKALLQTLKEHHASKTKIAWVGHEPWLSESAGWLLYGAYGEGWPLVLKKGGVAWLSGSPKPSGMHLRAWIPPKLIVRENEAARVLQL